MFATHVLCVLHALVAVMLLPISASTPGLPWTGGREKLVAGGDSLSDSRGSGAELHERGGDLLLQPPTADLLDVLQPNYVQKEAGALAYPKQQQHRRPALEGEGSRQLSRLNFFF